MSAPFPPRYLSKLQRYGFIFLLLAISLGGSAAGLATPADPRIASVIGELEKTRTIRQAASHRTVR